MTVPAGSPVRCSDAARARGDDPVATAPPAPRWLLVEQPGPWGPDALHESRLDPAVALALGERAAVAGVRVALIRRPGRAVEPERRRWAYADARPRHEGLWWGEVADDAELLGVPLDGSEGERTGRPALLVCAHGRHDTCCAVRGRPVAAALAQRHPEETWECSHVGGDRFAANVVVLPHALYYGRLSPSTALDVVAAYGEGRVVEEWLRGRASLSAAVQAAQHHARVLLGADADGLDALLPRRVEHLGRSRTRVLLELGSSSVSVTVRSAVTPGAELLTCAATRPSVARVWELVDLSVPRAVRSA